MMDFVGSAVTSMNIKPSDGRENQLENVALLNDSLKGYGSLASPGVTNRAKMPKFRWGSIDLSLRRRSKHN